LTVTAMWWQSFMVCLFVYYKVRFQCILSNCSRYS
jgi:hypothetical protein